MRCRCVCHSRGKGPLCASTESAGWCAQEHARQACSKVGAFVFKAHRSGMHCCAGCRPRPRGGGPAPAAARRTHAPRRHSRGRWRGGGSGRAVQVQHGPATVGGGGGPQEAQRSTRRGPAGEASSALVPLAAPAPRPTCSQARWCAWRKPAACSASTLLRGGNDGHVVGMLAGGPGRAAGGAQPAAAGPHPPGAGRPGLPGRHGGAGHPGAALAAGRCRGQAGCGGCLASVLCCLLCCLAVESFYQSCQGAEPSGCKAGPARWLGRALSIVGRAWGA